MKRIIFLVLVLISFKGFGQTYQTMAQKYEFKDSLKFNKHKNNVAGDSILSTDVTGRVIQVVKPAPTDTSSLSDRINLKVNKATSLTINGTAYDLSANRSWSVGTLVAGDTTSLSSRIDNKWGQSGNSIPTDATFIGTTNSVPLVLKAHNTEFQRLVPYTGTDTGYFGYVINSNYVTSPGSFTTQITAAGGASATTVAGGKSLSVGATNFTQVFYIPNVWPSSVLPKESYRAVGIKTAANNGLILSQEIATTAPSYWARLWAEYDFNTRIVTIKLTNAGGTSTLATSSALSSAANNDSIACYLVWNYNQISATMTDLNNSATTTVSTGFSPPNYAPTIYLPCMFFPLTTNPTVLQSLQVYVEAYKNPDINVVGHSFFQGYAGVTRAQLIPELLRAAMPQYKIQVDAMGSMKISDAMLWKDEMKKINGKRTLIGLGANDGPVSDATFYSGYRAYRDTVVASGSIPVHMGQVPQAAYDFTARNDSLKILYESLGDIYVNVFPLLKASVGTGLNPYYDVGDGLHLSAAGDSLVASEILEALSPVIGPPVNQDYVDFSKNLNLVKVASYQTQQTFNSDRDIPDVGYVKTAIDNRATSGVTSIGITGNDGISVAGSPVTSTGNITLDLGTITPTAIRNDAGSVSAPPYSYASNTTTGILLSSGLNNLVTNQAGASFATQNRAAGSSAGMLMLNTSGSTLGFIGINNSDNGAYYNNVASGATHRMQINSADKLVIFNNGNIGIDGATTGPYPLTMGSQNATGFKTNLSGGNDQIYAYASNTGAVMTIQNTYSGGYSGIQYADNAGGVQVFTGLYIPTNEMRFNNIGPGGIVSFQIGSVARLNVNNGGNVGMRDGLYLGASATTAPVASAQLEMSSTTQGFLPPRMTSAQANAISSPATGLIVFCTDCTAIDASTGVTQTWNGATWKKHW